MKKKTKIIIIIISIIVIAVAGYSVYGMYKINKLADMTFDEMISYTNNDNPDAVTAVGIIENGEVSVTFYGENGDVIEDKGYEYEIGSISKTFTTSLLCKMIDEGSMSLNDSIDMYIDLPEQDYYPTLDKMVTHTSGYKAHYIDKTMFSNILDFGGNDYLGVTCDMLNEQIADKVPEDRIYDFRYSNFGMSVVGQVLANELNDDYINIMTDYIVSDLGLENTRISDGTGNMDGYWQWNDDDAYLPVGALISTIDDMMEYLSMHMTEEIPYLAYGHDIVAEVDAAPAQYQKLGIRMDSMGVGWVLDTQNNIIWHDGGTSEFNSYIGFDKDKQVGVVILSNLPPSYRVPATVMGSRIVRDLQENAQ